MSDNRLVKSNYSLCRDCSHKDRCRRLSGRKSSIWIDLLWAIIFAAFILSFSISFVLLFKPLFYLDIRIFDLEAESGLSASVIRRNYDSLISYLFFLNRKTLFLPDFAMSSSGRIHFEDCKRIFDLAQWTCLLSGSFLLLYIIRYRRLLSGRSAIISGILLTAFPAFTGVWAFADWESLFISFHKLCFQNDFWLFDPVTDPVILILPDGFFLQCLLIILFIVIGSGIICLAAGFAAFRKLPDCGGPIQNAAGPSKREF